MYSTKRIINHHKKFLNKHTTIIRSLVIPIVNHKWIKFLVSLRWCWIEPIQILFQPSKQILFKFNLEPFWLIYINFFIYVTKDRSTLQIFVTTKPKITLIQDFSFLFFAGEKISLKSITVSYIPCTLAMSYLFKVQPTYSWLLSCL